MPVIKEKFMKTDYPGNFINGVVNKFQKRKERPLRFINSVVNEFQKVKESGDGSFIIPANLFVITKPCISIEIPYCELNAIKSKHLEEISQIHSQ